MPADTDKLPDNIALQSRVTELERELSETKKKLQEFQQEKDKDKRESSSSCSPPPLSDLVAATSSSSVSSGVITPPPAGKSGYLFKWQDRSIGWGGTKWSLRYVSLDSGRIMYYLSHLENSPRYVLSLRGCAVHDDGWKRNRRHHSKHGNNPPIDEQGAYFFVFSIHHRPDSAALDYGNDNSNNNNINNSKTFNSGQTTINESFIPLLRFSTNSLAEKSQWIQLISEACAYCETDSFLQQEAIRNAEQESRRQEQIKMANFFPQAERGTLPPLYFATARPKSLLKRRPSLTKLPKSDLYRSKSASNDADKIENTKSTKGYPPSRPMHRHTAPSFLSTEAPQQNYRGFFNLAVIILIISNFRIILETIRSHGFLFGGITIPTDLSLLGDITQYPVVNGMFVLQFFIVTCYVIEKSLSREMMPETVGMILHQLNAHSSLAISIAITWNFIERPVVGGFLLFNATIIWMKLLSYIHANEDYRLSQRNSSSSTHVATLALIENLDTNDWDISYPKNVTLGNLYYFWLAPTLTYQIAFPKTSRVRFLKVVGILIRMVICFSIFSFLVVQVVAPNLERLLQDLEATNGKYTYGILADYWLKLTLANTYLWLLMFYFYFHLYLNLFAEVLRFGDRVFYKDWWNSMEVSSYWRLWNLPVHYWLIRHVYFPCIRMHMSKTQATFTVFFISAIMHEVLISLPFHMIRPWLFMGMMMQIPLVFVTKFLVRKFPGTSIGNIIFWMSFCVVGQPMAILMYTIDYKYGKLHPDSEPLQIEFDHCRFALWDFCVIPRL